MTDAVRWPYWSSSVARRKTDAALKAMDRGAKIALNGERLMCNWKVWLENAFENHHGTIHGHDTPEKPQNWELEAH